MKHPIISYELYRISKLIRYSVRVKVLMKEEVDIDVLRKSVNTATDRYPYFKLRVKIGDDGAFITEPNDNEIAVIPSSASTPALGSEQVGYHLLYVECDGKAVYFNICHALSGAKGCTPWVQTCLWQYVVDKYGVCPEAPAIRKPGSPLLPYEDAQPTMEMTDGARPIKKDRFKGSRAMLWDYLNGLFNPLRSSNEYYQLAFAQKDIMKYAKGSDNSVLSLFQVLMFKAMAKVFPKDKIITGQTPHNPAQDLGIPGAYFNCLTHVYFPFTDKMKDWDLDKLGTAARGSLVLQVDPMFSLTEERHLFEYFEGIDSVDGYEEKKKYAKKHSPTFGSDAVRSAFIVSYAGYFDWGGVADYIDSFYYIADGHLMLELSAIDDKIFCAFQQVVRTDRYITAFKKVIDEMNIPYTITGPYQKELPDTILPEVH